MTDAPLLTAWRVVLVSPQTSENVGAVARIMANFGVRDLVVVEPRCECSAEGPAGKLAREFGRELLEGMRTAASLQEALADAHFSICLTMQTSEDRPVEHTGFSPRAILESRPPGEVRALVFGREDRGLTNDECSLCSARWSVPTNPAAPSLNLAQAVAIALAGVAAVEYGAVVPAEESQPATQQEIDGLMGHLEQVLVAAKYERGVPVELPLRLMRRAALRARLGISDVRVLRGICRRLLNAILGYERRP